MDGWMEGGRDWLAGLTGWQAGQAGRLGWQAIRASRRTDRQLIASELM